MNDGAIVQQLILLLLEVGYYNQSFTWHSILNECHFDENKTCFVQVTSCLCDVADNIM